MFFQLHLKKLNHGTILPASAHRTLISVSLTICKFTSVCYNTYRGETHAERQAEQNYKTTKTHGEAAGIILIAVGVFLGVCVFVRTDTGLLGGALRDVFLGLFGLFTYAVPFIFVVIGALIIAARNKKVNKGKVALIVMFVIAVLSLVHTFVLSELELDKGFFAYVADSYRLGGQSAGAGAFGCLLVYPCNLLIGDVGCIILFITMALVSVLVLTNLSLKKMGQDVAMVSKRTVQRAISASLRKKHRIDMQHLLEDEIKTTDPDEPDILGAHSFRRRKQHAYLDDEVFEDVPAKAAGLPMPAEPADPPVRPSIEVYEALEG